jgi:ubiquinone/menaquinone biosynthesis C-methylase UbiE
MKNNRQCEEHMMPGYRQVLFSSEYLTNIKKLYGWTSEVATFSLGGMVASLETLEDWRVDNMLAMDLDHGLKLRQGEGGIGLEVGFGTGSLTICARRRGLNIVGIDYTAEYMRVARELASMAGLDDRELYQVLRQDNVEDLSFPKNHFALIICSGVLQYVGDIFAAMREMLRTLKPGGIMLLDAPDYRFPFESTYNIPWVPFMKEKVARAWLEGFDKPEKGLKFIKYVSLPHCLGIMKAVGFNILKAHTTVSGVEISKEIDKVLVGYSSDYLVDDPEKAFLMARKVNREGLRLKPCSFIITAQKPFDKTVPAGNGRCH